MSNNKPIEFKLPPIDMEPDLGVNGEKFSAQYGEVPFDPVGAGFNDWEFAGFLPYRKSIDVPSSPIGIGYETLDRDMYDFARTLPVMRNSGVKWARVQTGWNKPEKVKGVYDFKWLDEIVDGLLAIGIQPWLSVSYGNALYTVVNDNPRKGYVPYVPLHYGAEAVQGWKNYAAALAEHYAGRVTHWEVWNEPNAGFWGREANPAEYVELVKITAASIRARLPNAKIIGGAISGAGCCNGYINGLVANGIADYIDVFSYHPYGAIPELYIENRLKYIKRAFAGCGKQIEFWQGECGRPSRSDSAGRGWKLTTANQARYLTRRILTDLRIGFDMTSYFLVADLRNYVSAGVVYHDQGVIDLDDYKPKPAFYALQSMACLFDAQSVYQEGACIEINPADAFFLNRSFAEYNAVTAGFARGDIPIYAWYFPESVDIDYGFRRVRMDVWVDAGLRLENPVLIDPITRKVFRYKRDIAENRILNSNCSVGGQMYRFRPLPMLDYPLFLADNRIVGLAD